MTKQSRAWRPLLAITAACLFALVAAFGPPLATPAQAAPILILEPEQGPCNVEGPVILAHGRGFTPGQEILVSSQYGHQRMGGNPVPVAADGTFTAPVRLFGCDPATPMGTLFYVFAQLTEAGKLASLDPLAQATFTVAPAPAAPVGLPNTGGGGQAPTGVPVAPLIAMVAAILLSGIAAGRGRQAR